MIIRRFVLFFGFALLLFLSTPTIAKADSNGFHYEGISGTSGNPCPWIRVTAWGWNYLENTIPGHSDSPIDVWQIQADVYDKSLGTIPVYVGTLKGGGYPGAKITFIENQNFCGSLAGNPSYKLNANNALIWVSTVPYDPSAVGKSDPYTASGWKPLAFRAPLFSPNPAVASNAKIWVDAIHYQQSYLTPTSPINDSILTDATFSNPMTITEDDWGMRDAATPGVIDYGQCYAYLGLLRWNSGPPFGFDQSSPTTCEPLGAQFGAGYTGTEQHRTFAVPVGKPGSYGDPYPLDGHYTWNIMAAQGTDQSHSRYSNADDTSPNTSSLINFPYKLMNTTTGRFWLFTNLQASPNISVNGDYPANGKSYPAGSITVRASVTNVSTKIAAQPSVATMTISGGTLTTPLTASPTIGILNPGVDGYISLTANLGPGTYSVQVCANDNFAVYSVSGRHCTTSRFSIFTPTPPAPNTVISPCTGAANLTWNSLTGATAYNVRISTNSAALATAPPTATVTTTSYPYAITEGTTYYWQVQAVYGATTTAWSSPVSSFTTPLCKRYSVTTSAVQPSPLAPGNSGTENMNVAVAAGSGQWKDNDVIILSVNNWGAGTCTSGIKNGINVTPGNRTSTYTGGSGGSFSTPLAFSISTLTTTTPGPYQICFTISTGPDQDVLPGQPTSVTLNFLVNYQSWFQVSAINSAAGDIHSNGGFTMSTSGVGNGYLYDSSVLPYYSGAVVGQHNAGVVGAVGTLLLNTANGSLPPYPYLTAHPYATVSPTSLKSTFANFLETARSRTGFSSRSLPGGTTLTGGNTGCAAGGQIGQVSRSGSGDFTLGPMGCSVLIVGDSSSQANLKITSNVNSSQPLILLVNGDVTVSPAVTNLDATIILTGNFNDGTNAPLSDAVLTINGSVLEIGNGVVSFNRYLANNATPAERIVYQPGQLDTLRSLIGASTYSWVEKQ